MRIIHKLVNIGSGFKWCQSNSDEVEMVDQLDLMFTLNCSTDTFGNNSLTTHLPPRRPRLYYSWRAGCKRTEEGEGIEVVSRMLSVRGGEMSLVPGRTKFTCTGVMCVNFSASSVCKMLWLSLTGKLSHVPSVVLSMLETNHRVELSSRFVTRVHAPHSTHAVLQGWCAGLKSPGRNSNSFASNVPSTAKLRRWS